MKKGEAIALLLLGVLLISPLVYAQSQSQTYSGFNRFTDSIKLFFSFGDNKIRMALNIREKEVNSAIENIEKNNTENVNKNLENAFNKLILVQEKVSPEVADEVETSVEEVVGKIEISNLTNVLDRYVLEEKKTQLVAKLVVEVEGKEGQTLTREVVKNGTDGRRVVNVVVTGQGNETRIVEIEGEMNQIENNVAEWTVEHTYAPGTGPSGENVGVVVEGGTDVKNYVEGNGTVKNEPLPEPNLNQINPDLYDPNARAPGDTVDETYDDNNIIEGNCGNGVVCEGGSSSS